MTFGWDGAGHFNLQYFFVQDSNNGIKILSARQDAQWALVAAGLMNCYTLDSETVPTAPLNMHNFKITNVGTPALTTDAAQYGNITQQQTGPAFRRNVLYNPEFMISQYFVASGTTLAAARAYVMDHWQGQTGAGTNATYTQMSSPGLAGFENFIRVQRVAANAGVALVQLAQSLETFDSIQFQGQQMTFSFWYRTGANFSGATLNAAVYTGTGIDENILVSYTGLTNVIALAPSPSSGWTQAFGTANIGATATEVAVDIYYTPSGTAGANDYVDITGVQLEIAPLPTAFQHMPFQWQMRQCMNWYEKSGVYFLTMASNLGSNSGAIQVGAGKAGANPQYFPFTVFTARKRTSAPTITFFNPVAAGAQAYDNTALAACTGTAVVYLTEKGFTATCTGAAGTAVGNQLVLSWAANNEL